MVLLGNVLPDQETLSRMDAVRSYFADIGNRAAQSLKEGSPKLTKEELVYAAGVLDREQAKEEEKLRENLSPEAYQQCINSDEYKKLKQGVEKFKTSFKEMLRRVKESSGEDGRIKIVHEHLQRIGTLGVLPNIEGQASITDNDQEQLDNAREYLRETETTKYATRSSWRPVKSAKTDVKTESDAMRERAMTPKWYRNGAQVSEALLGDDLSKTGFTQTEILHMLGYPSKSVPEMVEKIINIEIAQSKGEKLTTLDGELLMRIKAVFNMAKEENGYDRDAIEEDE